MPPPPDFVNLKLQELFAEWLSLPESQLIVHQTIVNAKSDREFGSPLLSPHFSAVPSSPSRTSPPGCPLLRPSREGEGHDSLLSHGGGGYSGGRGTASSSLHTGSLGVPSELLYQHQSYNRDDQVKVPGSDIPRFWWPKRPRPADEFSGDLQTKVHDCFVQAGIKGITTHSQMEPFCDVFGVSKYFAGPVFHKLKAFHNIKAPSGITGGQNLAQKSMLAASSVPLSESMLMSWCRGRVQLDDPVLTFFWIVKKDHNDWIEREDLSLFLSAVLMSHPGLDFLRDTAEFQDRYADTVISRIFYVYDRHNSGKIYLKDLRRYRPSVIDTWKQLAEHDDIKMVRDFFSYEHFYVMYCTFWELDDDHDFLLDKEDLLKYDGHALSRRATERIFSEIPTKFTSAVPGKMGYEDFIYFLLCDQDRQTDRSLEYWFHLLDLDGDGCIADQELRYFYEEQAQRLECLNYETISFADVLCQMNDMIFPKTEGKYYLSDFKRKRKLAGTFFSVFLSLNKFLAFEHRDPFSIRQEQLEHPGQTDWDRFCASEYLRLAMEEGDEWQDSQNATATNEAAGLGRGGSEQGPISL